MGRCVQLIISQDFSSLKAEKVIKLDGKNENQIQKKLIFLNLQSHTNIIQFREAYKTQKGNVHIVMEYAGGNGDLEKKIKDAKGKYFHESKILHWFYQICSAINHIHNKNIIHRDIKAENIFLTKKVILKQEISEYQEFWKNHLKKCNLRLGQLQFKEPYTTMTDIWSLGVLLYRLCALKYPFEGDQQYQVLQSIAKCSYQPIPNKYSDSMKQLIESMLQIDETKRLTAQQILGKDHVYFQIKLKIYLIKIQVFHRQNLKSHMLLNQDQYRLFNQINKLQKIPTIIIAIKINYNNNKNNSQFNNKYKILLGKRIKKYNQHLSHHKEELIQLLSRKRTQCKFHKQTTKKFSKRFLHIKIKLLNIREKQEKYKIKFREIQKLQQGHHKLNSLQQELKINCLGGFFYKLRKDRTSLKNNTKALMIQKCNISIILNYHFKTRYCRKNSRKKLSKFKRKSKKFYSKNKNKAQIDALLKIEIIIRQWHLIQLQFYYLLQFLGFSYNIFYHHIIIFDLKIGFIEINLYKTMQNNSLEQSFANYVNKLNSYSVLKINQDSQYKFRTSNLPKLIVPSPFESSEMLNYLERAKFPKKSDLNKSAYIDLKQEDTRSFNQLPNDLYQQLEPKTVKLYRSKILIKNTKKLTAVDEKQTKII
ncbi:unnamed protein product (macronuclear) [Paramecium tetraurelia]|uniref:non-specific serine/threonine protein kinase n=1 Tax=Paramecium tetraurelia TaxID=5888 RepID=A0BF22_PARTE|nr:uncharacterized protein GSPATT00028174001 [Paramecium tetraurelia]CAK57139.1 unnamed protein product [Paramecium tetraurelia]|eukprot:XP_001424537.1 hypothetical protein (macronuclear) [Paramecium tetraurelia strain d4-2]